MRIKGEREQKRSVIQRHGTRAQVSVLLTGLVRTYLGEPLARVTLTADGSAWQEATDANCQGSDLFNDSESLALWEIGCVIVKASCLTCEPTYMIVPNLARTCDSWVIVSGTYGAEARSPFDTISRPWIGSQW